MDEFDIIRRYFVPLAEGFPEALGLKDDAALLAVPPGQSLVITQDAISAGVHFTGDEDAELTAQRLLRVNLSDLAAKGARPLCYFLALMLPETTIEPWVTRFAEGLMADQKRFGIHLGGGDTTAIKGPPALSLTAIGTVKDRMLTRSGAKPGDDIYVSGTLGEAAASGWKILPEPRLALGQALLEQRIASACMDISDGLVQDLGHICAASGVGATVKTECVLRAKADLLTALSGGDDYELLFTAPQAEKERIATLAKQLALPLTRIGIVTEGKEVLVLDAADKPLALARRGYRHFSGSV